MAEVGGRTFSRVHHVAYIVRDIEASLGFYRDTLGLPVGLVLPIESDEVIVAFLEIGETKIELVQPTSDTTGVARFLEKKGEGFHHVCFETPDVDATLADLAENKADNPQKAIDLWKGILRQQPDSTEDRRGGADGTVVRALDKSVCQVAEQTAAKDQAPAETGAEIAAEPVDEDAADDNVAGQVNSAGVQGQGGDQGEGIGGPGPGGAGGTTPDTPNKEVTMPEVNVDQWVEMFRAIGLDETTMHKWHAEFERRHPAGHQAFLEWLNLPGEQIAEIRQ